MNSLHQGAGEGVTDLVVLRGPPGSQIGDSFRFFFFFLTEEHET